MAAPRALRREQVRRRVDLPAVGACAAVVLMTIAMIIPPAFGWNVHALTVPPLAAHWQPRVGWGTAPAVVLAIVGARVGPDLAEKLGFGRLLAVSYGAGLAWLVALATVDGWAGPRTGFEGPGGDLTTAGRRPSPAIRPARCCSSCSSSTSEWARRWRPPGSSYSLQPPRRSPC